MENDFLTKLKELLTVMEETSHAFQIMNDSYGEEYKVRTHGDQRYTVNLPQMLCDCSE